jgi:hypothetical protein
MDALQRFFVVGLIVVSLGLVAEAQTPGTASMTTVQMTGEVLLVEGDTLVVRMGPRGEVRTFDVEPGQKFTIDGQPKTVGELQPGTMLTATVTTASAPATLRNETSVSGTVFFAAGNNVILTMENGENRQFTVPESASFIVDGREASVNSLRRGMRVTAERVVEQPKTVFTTTSTITGTSPKK